jgi:hypothetical protein
MLAILSFFVQPIFYILYLIQIFVNFLKLPKLKNLVWVLENKFKKENLPPPP